MDDKEENEVVESVESDKLARRILLVGTHQGASLVMANMVKHVRVAIKEAVTSLTVPPQRSFPRKAKKGRSRSY
jgi:hypothetical protein